MNRLLRRPLSWFSRTPASNLYVEKPPSSFLILALLVPFTIVIILFTLMPIIFTLTFAFREKVGFRNNEYVIGMGNFSKIYYDGNFRLALSNTLLFTALAVPITIFVSLLIATLISSLINRWFRGFWQTIYFLPYVTNSVAIFLAISFLFYPNGIFNSLTGSNIDWLRQGLTAKDQIPGTRWTVFFVLTYSGVWVQLGFNILILATAILGVNANLYKAASIDGVSRVKQFFSITLPFIKNHITFLVTYGVIHSLKFFPIALFDNSATKSLISQGVTLVTLLFIFTTNGNFSFAGALTIIIFILSIAVTFIVRIILQKTIDAFGALKLQKQKRLTKNFSSPKDICSLENFSACFPKTSLWTSHKYLFVGVGVVALSLITILSVVLSI